VREPDRRILRALDGHVRGHLQLVQPRPGSHPVPQRPHDQPPVRRATAIPGLAHDSRYMLARIDMLTAAPAALDLLPHVAYAGEELWLVVERGHHHMPPLPPLRVIAVMADNEAPHAVVLGVNSRHTQRVSRPPGSVITVNGATRSRAGR